MSTFMFCSCTLIPPLLSLLRPGLDWQEFESKLISCPQNCYLLARLPPFVDFTTHLHGGLCSREFRGSTEIETSNNPVITL